MPFPYFNCIIIGMETSPQPQNEHSLPTSSEELGLFIDAQRNSQSFKDMFELGVALSEEIAHLLNDVPPIEPAPSQRTEHLRKALSSTLQNCDPGQKEEIALLLDAKFELVSQDLTNLLTPVADVTEPASELSESFVSKEEYFRLARSSGIGSPHAWTHGWSRARSLGLVDENEQLDVQKLKVMSEKWSKKRPYRVGQATLSVYLKLIEQSEDRPAKT